jgi:alanine dehydrogenase
MTLIINNKEVAQVLTMPDTIAALETSYLNLASGEAVCRPRIDIRIPTSDPTKNYQWGTMEGGSTGGYFAIRMKSDIIYESQYNGVITQEKYCTKPGLFCGLILLTSIENAEPLALINDGHLQHMRVGGDGGIGVKYMARKDAEVVGIIGSGGMARTHMQSFTAVRNIRKVQVFSPTKANREAFAEEIRAQYGIEVQVCDAPEQVYRGAHIVAGLTDSAVPVLNGDVYLRFGDAPAPLGRPDLALADEYIAWEARPNVAKHGGGGKGKKAHGVTIPEKRITLADLVSCQAKGRTSDEQITYSERGNLQGAQFYAVAGRVYELVKAAGLGHEIPTEWFLQDIRN